MPPKMVVSICGEAGSQLGTIDWTATKEDGVAPIVSGKCVSKQLYINDADEKRKKVEVLVKFMMAGDLELGTFASKPIKVISKPSKKRQSIKNMERKSLSIFLCMLLYVFLIHTSFLFFFFL